MKKSVFLAALAASTVMPGARAHADDRESDRSQAVTARMCNHTDQTIYAAVGYHDDEFLYHAQGWWDIAPKRCRDLRTKIRGAVLMYAEDADGDSRWVPDEGYGSVGLCINTATDFRYDELDCGDLGPNMRRQEFGQVVDSDRDGIALYNVR